MASTSLASRLVTRTVTSAGYVAGSYPTTPVPTARELHMLNRMGYGFTPAALDQLRAAGGEMAWFEKQLSPEAVAEHPKVGTLGSFYPKLTTHSPIQKWGNDQGGTYPAWEYARDLANYSMLRRIYSRRGLHEVMAEFWSNHLHVTANHGPGFTQRMHYDETIRQHALSTFEELLTRCTLHPAMLLYLDNWKSRYGNPNENHGRELLELHTVGRQAQYGEAAVKASAKILSGWTVNRDSWEGVYSTKDHTTGSVTVLGFNDTNSSSDGRDLTHRYLRYLARHPATAQRICRKLAIRFVRDDPPQDLVDRLARVYLSSGTDIKAVLRALVNDDAFWVGAGRKARTPIDDLVATYRVLGVEVLSPISRKSGANAMGYPMGSTLAYHWVTPDGAPDDMISWASPTRMLNSFKFHWALTGGYYPKERVTYRQPVSYLPQPRIRFDKLVDHLCRVVLGRRSDARILQACCEGAGVKPGEIVTAEHAVMRYKFVRVMAVLLDSPEHMTR
jgi:hypothetical protein